jgi:hypothetical protein
LRWRQLSPVRPDWAARLVSGQKTQRDGTRMLVDIVLDTNVLMHADNVEEPRCQMSRGLLAQLKASTTHLCVDEGFDLDEAKNRSQIGSEYLKHLHHGMLGLAVVAHLAGSQRIRFVSRGVPPNVSKKIRTQIGKGPDRTYLKVAFNSGGKTLACHDFGDVPASVRTRLRAQIGVYVLDAEAALAALR